MDEGGREQQTLRPQGKQRTQLLHALLLAGPGAPVPTRPFRERLRRIMLPHRRVTAFSVSLFFPNYVTSASTSELASRAFHWESWSSTKRQGWNTFTGRALPLTSIGFIAMDTRSPAVA